MLYLWEVVDIIIIINLHNILHLNFESREALKQRKCNFYELFTGSYIFMDVFRDFIRDYDC